MNKLFLFCLLSVTSRAANIPWEQFPTDLRIRGPLSTNEVSLIVNGGSFSDDTGGFVIFQRDYNSTAPTNDYDTANSQLSGRWNRVYPAVGGPNVFIGRRATANTNWVNVAPATAYTAGAGAANFGPTSGTSREFIQLGQDFRIRQSGTVQGARLYLPNKTAVTSFKVGVWRYNGSTYDLVGRSEDVTAQITAAATSTITFASPIVDVREGDYYGVQILSGAFSTQNFYTLTSGFQATTPTIYYVDGSTPASTNYAWASQTAATSRAFVCELLMRAPVAVFIGDSIAAGHGNNGNVEHYSFLEASTATHITNTWPNRVAASLGWTYQNMGIGGNKLYDPANVGNVFAMGVSNRLTRDVLNLSPKYAFFNIGRNDITGSTTQTQFTNAWRVIFDACIAANVTPVVNYMFSGDDLSSGNLALLDTYNTALGTLIANSYSTTVIAAVTKPYMNTYNPAYPAVLTNLYAFKPEVDCGDNIHPSPLGYGRLADATLAAFSRAVINGSLFVKGGLTIGNDLDVLQINAGNMTLDDGVSNLPSVKSKYEDTGVGRSSAGNWSTWIGGTRELDLSSTRLGPAADGGLSLGLAGADRFDKAYVRTAFVAPYGTNTVPSISFYQHEDSGLFYNDVATDTISLVGSGTRFWDFRMTDGAWVAATDGGANIGRDGADRPGNVFVQNTVKAPVIWATSNLLTSGRTVATPAAVQSLSTNSQIVASNTTVAFVSGNGGNITISATTTIPPGVDGQHVVIIGTSDTNTVTLQDESILAGTWLLLGGANKTLGRGDTLGLRYSTQLGKWNMEFFSDVSSAGTNRVVVQDIMDPTAIAINNAANTTYFFTGAQTNASAQTFLVPTSSVPAGATLSINVMGTNVHGFLPLQYYFVYSGVTNRLYDSNRLDLVYTGAQWNKKPTADWAGVADDQLYGWRGPFGGTLQGPAVIPIQSDASADSTPWLRYNGNWTRLVAGANVTIVTNGSGEISVASSGGGGGATNGSAVSVDGTYLSELNLTDSTEVDLGASGTNVTAVLRDGTVATNRLSSAALAYLKDRATDTGLQAVSTLSDFNTNVWLRTLSIFQRGNGLSFATNSGANTLTLSGNYLPGANITHVTNADGSITVSATSGGGSSNGTPVAINGSFPTTANFTNGSDITPSLSGSNVTMLLVNTAVTNGTYTNATITVDANGRITFAASGTSSGGSATNAPVIAVDGTVTTNANFADSMELLVTQTGTNVTYALATNGVTAGTYSNATVTVDDKGRVTTVATGSSGGTYTNTTDQIWRTVAGVSFVSTNSGSTFTAIDDTKTVYSGAGTNLVISGSDLINQSVYFTLEFNPPRANTNYLVFGDFESSRGLGPATIFVNNGTDLSDGRKTNSVTFGIYGDVTGTFTQGGNRIRVWVVDPNTLISGDAITGLDASIITSGTFDVARMPSSVLLDSEAALLYGGLNNNNNWTGTQTFTNDVDFLGDVSFNMLTVGTFQSTTWTNLGDVTVGSNLVVNGSITLGGVARTNWPTGGGSTVTINGSGTLTNIADGADITLATSGGTTATPTLTDTGVTNGTYTLGMNGNTATVDAKGRITAIEDFDNVNDFDLVDEFVGPSSLLLFTSSPGGGQSGAATSAVTLTNLMGSRYMLTTGSNQYPSLYVSASMINSGMRYAQISMRYYFPLLSDDSDIWEHFMGAFNTIPSATNMPTFGSFIIANTNRGNANFWLCNATNSSYSYVDTGISASALTWHNWTVRMTPSNSIALYGQTPVATNSTTYATSTYFPAWGLRVSRYTQTAGAHRYVYIDNGKISFRAGPGR